MQLIVYARWDGSVLIPETPLDLPPGTRVRLTIWRVDEAGRPIETPPQRRSDTPSNAQPQSDDP
jgi:predicted DNA-binding antitoxin AbrB/MazE fold protein